MGRALVNALVYVVMKNTILQLRLLYGSEYIVVMLVGLKMLLKIG